MRNLLIILPVLFAFVFNACSSDSRENDVDEITIDRLEDLKTSYESKEYSVKLSKDLTGLAEVKIHDYNSDFIRDLKLKGDKIEFWLEENTNTSRGYRTGQIDIISSGKVIQTFNIYQSRTPFAPTTLQWSNANATFDPDELADVVQSSNAKEITQFVYNLEKNTNGRDSYKNYSAFAYCIEMNPDPENNMEWYLPFGMALPIIRNGGWQLVNYKEYWTAAGYSNGAMAVKYSTNKVQTIEIKYSKSAYKNVCAERKE